MSYLRRNQRGLTPSFFPATGKRAQAVNLGTVVERACLFLLVNGVLAFLIHRLPLITFDGFLGGIFFARLLLRG